MSAEDELYDQLKKAMADARNSKREAFEESVRRGKVERDAIEAIHRGKISEPMELKKKLISAVELLKTYKKERDELQIKFENAAETSSPSMTCMPQFISEFSFAQIEEATLNFHPSLKIGEGGYGSVYKGLLGQTEVAIKKLHSQGPSKYQQEGQQFPLSWQTRIRIAAELCSVLVFLHSSKPHSIVHGDLKSENILLDANFMSKLSEFGICRVMSHDGNSSYIYPEFLTTGELNPDNDNSSSTNSLSHIEEFQKREDLTPKSDDDNSRSTNSLSYMADIPTRGDLYDNSSSTNSLSYITDILTAGDLYGNSINTNTLSDDNNPSSIISLSYLAEILTTGDLYDNSISTNSLSDNDKDYRIRSWVLFRFVNKFVRIVLCKYVGSV